MRTIRESVQNYDIFPLVVPTGKETRITIMPRGAHAAFTPGEKYDLHICPVMQGEKLDYPHVSGFDVISATADSDGGIRFNYAFLGEQEHFIRICRAGTDYRDSRRGIQVSLYSVESDLIGRYPFAGDLHMHTCRSDGRQAPAIVAANYRKHGYDFLGITDHQRYYGSLEAIEAYKNVPTEYTIIPGEEVHMPRGDENHINDVHIVNFGGNYSINGLCASRDQIIEKGDAKQFRSIGPDCPKPMTDEEYFAAVDAFAQTLDIPDGVERFPYASSLWIFDQINKAGGLPIFPHPYWIANVYQVPEKLTRALFDSKAFGAFEVLGGENYFEQNGFQTIMYYEQAAKGNRVPIVGSTDSHSSFANNRNAFICSTIVFAKENEKDELIRSIKDFYSVAVDSISTEYRMVGELRLVKYAAFLYENFFPRHDELCFEEGRLMHDYACGDTDAVRILTAINGRMKKQREKYFAF